MLRSNAPSPCPSPRGERGRITEAAAANWHAWLFLIAAAALGFWSSAATAPLFDLDEGAFSEATREMLARGDFLMTWLDGEPRYDKPVLAYWLQAGSVSVFGRNELAFRLPSLIAATLWMWLVFRFARDVSCDRDAALFAAGTLALSLMVMVVGHAATADAVLNLLIAFTMLSAWRWSVQPARHHLLCVYAGMGLGFLAKGPVAVAIPLVVTLLFFALQRRLSDWRRAVLWPPGWALFFAIWLPWAIALYARDGGEFFRHFLLQHNLGRFTATMQSHGGVGWYYCAALPLVVMPFTAALPRVLAKLRNLRGDPLDAFLLIWFGVVFVAFSLSATQLPHYILYGATPLFLLFGKYRRELPRRWIALTPGLAFLLLLAALPWWLPHVPVAPDRIYERAVIAGSVAAMGAAYHVITAAAAAAVLLLMVARLPTWQALLGAGLAQAAAVWLAVAPAYAAGSQEPVRRAAEAARVLAAPVVSYHTFMPSFSVYRDAVTPHRPPRPGEVVFLRIDRIADLRRELPDARFEPLFEQGGVALLKCSSDDAGTTDS